MSDQPSRLPPNQLPPDHAHVLIRPPLLYGIGLLCGLALRTVIPARLGFPGGPGLWQGIGLAMVFLAICLAGWAIAAFRRAGTHVEPGKPALAVVSDGPYGHSRNPMYVALTLLYGGLALVTDNPFILMGLIVILPVMSIGVVRREERYLAAKFGPAYEDYRARVRRWM